MPNDYKRKEELAKSLGTGAANRAAKAIIKRQKMNQEAADGVDSGSAPAQGLLSKPKHKMKDASAGATQDYQMQQAIEMVRKAKTARRTAY